MNNVKLEIFKVNWVNLDLVWDVNFKSFEAAQRAALAHIEKYPTTFSHEDNVFEIKMILVDKLSEQDVVIKGKVAGFQFNTLSMGARTEKRTVRNLHFNDDLRLCGEVTWHGRRLLVEELYLGYWITRERLD
jgi:hypothetical protein